ncbi:hypothetical protein [Granulicella sp. S190]|uniref:hypothetical protein n=1 Tax=Granulicella sp. S190 TaxID=1747226 RepID=UPI00131AC356|nr:hypothetical protein [Granulicella sp. S190]
MIQTFERDQDLVRHLKEYHNDADTRLFSVLDFASAFGSPLYALVYSKLFWPDFIELKGMIFHESIMESEEDRFRVEKALLAGQTRREIERSFNSFEIPSSFFSSNRGSTTLAEDVLLANRLGHMWRLRLLEVFPERTFTVDVECPVDEQPTIIVSQCNL